MFGFIGTVTTLEDLGRRPVFTLHVPLQVNSPLENLIALRAHLQGQLLPVRPYHGCALWRQPVEVVVGREAVLERRRRHAGRHAFFHRRETVLLVWRKLWLLRV